MKIYNSETFHELMEEQMKKKIMKEKLNKIEFKNKNKTVQ